MTLCIDLPKDIEASLRQQLSNLDHAAKEACLIEFYRQGQLTHHQLATALELDRYATDGVLKRHNVGYELSPEELARQVAALSQNR
ncbi:MAG: UPF0175 family protein [Pirellulales bacterium]